MHVHCTVGFHLCGMEKETRTALWRRVSSDTYYIIDREYGGYFIYGTQNEDRIQELWDKLWNRITMECDPNQSSHRVPVHTLRRKGMEIVKNTVDVFEKIENKHSFTDRDHVAKRMSGV